jgi:hypothetical protein
MADDNKPAQTITVGGQAQEKKPDAPNVTAKAPTSDSNTPARGLDPSTPQPAKGTDTSGPVQVPSGPGSSPSKPVAAQNTEPSSAPSGKGDNNPTVSDPGGKKIDAKGKSAPRDDGEDDPIRFDWEPIYMRFIDALDDFRNHPGVDIPEDEEGNITHPRFASFDHYIQGEGGPLAMHETKEQLKAAARNLAAFLNS